MPKLSKFNANKTNTNLRYLIISFAIIIVLTISFFVYKTFAYYKQIEEHDVIKTKVGDFRKAEYTYYDNTNTGLNCTGDDATVQCAIDELTPAKKGKKYYAFGNPTADSTTDYTTLGKNVFVGLDEGGSQKSVCIIRNNKLECFKNNNWNVEKDHIKQVFSDISCTVESSRVSCCDSAFCCYVGSDGNVRCDDYSDDSRCYVESVGSVRCE